MLPVAGRLQRFCPIRCLTKIGLRVQAEPGAVASATLLSGFRLTQLATDVDALPAELALTAGFGWTLQKR